MSDAPLPGRDLFAAVSKLILTCKLALLRRVKEGTFRIFLGESGCIMKKAPLAKGNFIIELAAPELSQISR